MFDYPLLAKRLAVREQPSSLAVTCLRGTGPTATHRNGDRGKVMLAKEKDVEYQTLQLKMTAVKRAYEVLPDD